MTVITLCPSTRVQVTPAPSLPKATAGYKFVSARFDGGEKERMAREIEKHLKALNVNTFMVESGAGEDFGTQTAHGLANMDAMIAICYDNYGEKTRTKYCSYYEVKSCYERDIPIIPVRLSEKWPPEPPGPREGAELLKLIFGPSRVYIAGAGKSPAEIAAEVATALAKLKKK